MKCPYCQSDRTVKNGTTPLKGQPPRQRYLCRNCDKRYRPVWGLPERAGVTRQFC